MKGYTAIIKATKFILLKTKTLHFVSNLNGIYNLSNIFMPENYRKK